MDPGPRAIQAPLPPATKMAAWPGAGGPPDADLTAPSVQVLPPFAETKNWARAARAPVWAPTATISLPSLAMAPRDWSMPRSLLAVVKSPPARVAGGWAPGAGGGGG